LCRASGARHYLSTFPSAHATPSRQRRRDGAPAHALGYLLNAPPALFLVVGYILDRPEFQIRANKTYLICDTGTDRASRTPLTLRDV